MIKAEVLRESGIERAKKLETRNYSKLILVREENSKGEEVYKMGGNSLLIYYCIIYPRLKEKPELDFLAGNLYFKEIAKFRRSLERIDVLKGEREGLDLVIFELNFFTTETRIRELRESMAVLKPKVVLVPVIYEKLRYIQRQVFELVAEMTEFQRDYNGRLILEYSRRMVKFYMMINDGLMAPEKGYKKIQELNNLLMIEVSFATELKTIPTRIAIRIGAELIEVKRDVDMEMRRNKGEG